jgi:hypothetical protein
MPVDWKKLAKRIFGSLLLIAGTVFLALQLLHITAALADFLNYATLAQALWEITGRTFMLAISAYLVVMGLRMINPAIIPLLDLVGGKSCLGRSCSTAKLDHPFTGFRRAPSLS